jgi:hypothetical protein
MRSKAKTSIPKFKPTPADRLAELKAAPPPKEPPGGRRRKTFDPEPDDGPPSRFAKLKAAYLPADPDAYSVEQFCAKHGISQSLFYKMRREGLGPEEIRLGVRVLISKEAAARWRAQREAAVPAE